MKKYRYRKAGAALFVLYLVLLTYFLFFAEEMGRSPEMRPEYTYNLVPFREIRRFLIYRDAVGAGAMFLNIFGNILAFVPFGFFLPVIWSRAERWYKTAFFSLTASFCIEIMQLVCRVGSFDVDDLLLNTVGSLAGYLIFRAAKRVGKRYCGTNRE